MKWTDVDIFLAGRGGPNSLLWQYLALPSGDENYFATPRVVVRPRKQDDQPNSDARTRSKLSTSACQCYHSRWSWGTVVSDQLLTIIPADKPPDRACIRLSLMAAVVEATLEATFSSPAAAAVLVESLKLERVSCRLQSIEGSGLTELWIHRRRKLAQTPKILMLTNYRGEQHEQPTIFCW